LGLNRIKSFVKKLSLVITRHDDGNNRHGFKNVAISEKGEAYCFCLTEQLRRIVCQQIMRTWVS